MKKELVTQVNAYLANIGVSYIKLHNLHWNVVGSQFKAAHEYLETLYDALADVLDAIAELLKITASFDLKYKVSLTSLIKLVYTNQKKMSIYYSFSYSRYLSYYPYWYKCYSPFIRQNIFYRRGHSRNGQER